jgi:glycosyltransferase involved in cell wall biosynthesis
MAFSPHPPRANTEFRQRKTIFQLLLGLRSADAIIAVSNTYKAFLSKKMREPERITVIWDAAEFEVEYSPPPVNEGLVVGYIGGAGWWQGLSFIIGAAKILAARKDITFVIAGFEPKDETLFPRLPNISYRGYVERKDVVSFITSCDVMLSTRVEETAGNLLFPLKLAEYMAAGRPVISSGAGDQVGIIQDAKCGIIATPISAETLATSIEQFAAMNPLAREAWGRQALSYARAHLLFPASKRKLILLYQGLGAKE